MSPRTEVRCRTAGCTGTLGAFASGGEFIPAGHLVGGRDWRVVVRGEAQATVIRCSRCGNEYTIQCINKRLTIARLVAA